MQIINKEKHEKAGKILKKLKELKIITKYTDIGDSHVVEGSEKKLKIIEKLMEEKIQCTTEYDSECGFGGPPCDYWETSEDSDEWCTNHPCLGNKILILDYEELVNDKEYITQIFNDILKEE